MASTFRQRLKVRDAALRPGDVIEVYGWYAGYWPLMLSSTNARVVRVSRNGLPTVRDTWGQDRRLPGHLELFIVTRAEEDGR